MDTIGRYRIREKIIADRGIQCILAFEQQQKLYD